MFSAFERLVAFRYLRARRQEGFVSVIAAFSLIGIFLGVATLIIVMSVMNGFRDELLTRILGLNGHMTVYAYEGGLTDFDAVANRIRGVEGVVAVSPIVDGQVIATTQRGATFGQVRGVRGDHLTTRPLVTDNIISGNLADFANGDGVVIGDRMAQKLGIRVGDSVTLLSPEGRATAFGTVPRSRAYPVVATFNIGMFEYDSTFVFMPLPLAQVYFQLPDAVTGIELTIVDPERIREVRPEVQRVVLSEGRVVDWRQANAHFVNALQVEQNVMFVILTLIVLVAAFNIIAGLIMVVKDKGRDIAILRTMGATRGQVLRIFFMNGAAIGVVGTVLGVGAGIAFAANIDTIRLWLESMTNTALFPPEIRFLSQLPAKIDPTEVAIVAVMAIGLSFLATIYPSWRAARIDPVEALRYE
jgi:lipoprotein-releasing system permease protein